MGGGEERGRAPLFFVGGSGGVGAGVWACCGASSAPLCRRARRSAAHTRRSLPRDAHHHCRGFGTVRFTSREDAEAAIEKLNNSDFEGRTVTERLDRYA